MIELSLNFILIVNLIPAAPSTCLHVIDQDVAIWEFLSAGDSGEVSV